MNGSAARPLRISQPARIAGKAVCDVWPAFHLAQEVGGELGRGEILLRGLSQENRGQLTRIPSIPVESQIIGSLRSLKQRRPHKVGIMFLAERTGLEPATPGVTGRYSNQLN